MSIGVVGSSSNQRSFGVIHFRDLRAQTINIILDQAVTMEDEVDEARLYLQIGDVEVSLSGSIREINDRWQSIKDEDDWKSSVALISRASQDASMLYNELPSKKGAGLARMIDNCGLHRTTDLILAAIYYLRTVEMEDDSPPRVLKKLLSSTGKWTEEDIEKWNISLYINRMVEGGGGDDKTPLLTYPPGKDKNLSLIHI